MKKLLLVSFFILIKTITMYAMTDKEKNSNDIYTITNNSGKDFACSLRSSLDKQTVHSFIISLDRKLEVSSSTAQAFTKYCQQHEITTITNIEDRTITIVTTKE